MKDGFLKGLLFMLMIVYIVSPVDFVPGPVDDLIVLMMGLASRKRIQ